MPKIIGPIKSQGGAIEQYNVRNHGATGDGATDDTAAIHNARTAAGAGGTVYFPPGTYVAMNLQATLADQTWRLHPNATVKLSSSNTNSDYLLRITASGVVIDGGKWNLTTVSGAVTRVDYIYSQGATLTGVTFQNMSVTGLGSRNHYGISTHDHGGVVIRNNKLTNCAFMVQNQSSLDKTNVSITGNWIDTTTGTASVQTGGIAVRADSPSTFTNVNVSNNEVRSSLNPGNIDSAALVTWRCYGVSITNNTTYGGYFGLTCPSSQNMTITGNSFVSPQAYGMEIPGCTNTVLVGNTVDFASNNFSAQTGVSFTGLNAGPIVIASNTFKGFASTTSGGSVGVLLGSGGTYTNVAINGNSFDFDATCNAPSVFYVNAALTRSNFSGNIVNMNSATGSRVLTAAGNLTSFTVSGNTLANLVCVNRYYGTAHTDVVVTGNTLTSVTDVYNTDASPTMTNVIHALNTHATDAILARVKAGAPTDADFKCPVNGLLVIDSSNGRLYFRYGGAWHYVSQTA